jgi:hypothetical protein
MFKERSTMDIVILIWSMTVAITLIIGVLGVLIGKLFRPTVEVTGAAEIIANMVMAIIGFIGGRTVGKAEANGK